MRNRVVWLEKSGIENTGFLKQTGSIINMEQWHGNTGVIRTGKSRNAFHRGSKTVFAKRAIWRIRICEVRYSSETQDRTCGSDLLWGKVDGAFFRDFYAPLSGKWWGIWNKGIEGTVFSSKGTVSTDRLWWDFPYHPNWKEWQAAYGKNRGMQCGNSRYFRSRGSGTDSRVFWKLCGTYLWYRSLWDTQDAGKSGCDPKCKLHCCGGRNGGRISKRSWRLGG